MSRLDFTQSAFEKFPSTEKLPPNYGFDILPCTSAMQVALSSALQGTLQGTCMALLLSPVATVVHRFCFRMARSSRGGGRW